MIESEQDFWRKLNHLWRAPEKLTISQHADKYRWLSPEASDIEKPERWVTDFAPYQREMMDVVTDRHVKEVCYCTSTQVGKSEILNNIAHYYMHQEPSSIYFIQPAEHLAREYSRDRIRPMIRDCKDSLYPLFSHKSKDPDNMVLHKSFPGGYLALAGANAPGNLASKPIPIVLVDEVDRMKPTSEGDAVEILYKRTSNFRNAKFIVASTPTHKGDSRITSIYDASDQRKYYVPCPYCGHMQILLFENLVYPLDKNELSPSTVCYVCDGCKERFLERYKPRMLRKGAWRKHAMSRKIGFWINELYSPWRKWWEIVESYIDCKDDPYAYMVWVNTSKAEVYEEQGEAPSSIELYNRNRGTYKRGFVPEGVVILVAGVDVQQDRLEVEIVGYGRGLESWSIDYIVLYGDTRYPEVWENLAGLMSQQWPGHDNRVFSVRAWGLDSGGATKDHKPQTYKFAAKYKHKFVYLVKGRATQETIIQPPKSLELNRKGKVKKYGYIKVWPVGTDFTKTELYGWLKVTPTGQVGEFPGACHFPSNYTESYFEGLTAEYQSTEVDSKGYKRKVWKKRSGVNNEPLDCRVYARAMAYRLRLDFWSNEKWKRAEESILRSKTLCESIILDRQKSAVTEIAQKQATEARVAAKTSKEAIPKQPVEEKKNIVRLESVKPRKRRIVKRKRVSSFW
jgi:phage terminase large subunit GpA-like protein